MKNESGFTLLELLVAAAIIGILAAVAIPQYAGYKSRAIDSQLQSALKNARTAMEAYYTNYTEYSADEGILEPNGYSPTESVAIDILHANAIDYGLRVCKPGGTEEFGFEFNTNGPNAGHTIPAPAACGS